LHADPSVTTTRSAEYFRRTERATSLCPSPTSRKPVQDRFVSEVNVGKPLPRRKRPIPPKLWCRPAGVVVSGAAATLVTSPLMVRIALLARVSNHEARGHPRDGALRAARFRMMVTLRRSSCSFAFFSIWRRVDHGVEGEHCRGVALLSRAPVRAARCRPLA